MSLKNKLRIWLFSVFQDKHTWFFASSRREHNVVEALEDTAAVLISTLDFELVLDRILANVGKVVPHEAINIMLIDEGMVQVVRRRGDEEYIEKAIELNRKVPLKQMPKLLKMCETGKPEIIRDTRGHLEWIDFPESHWVKSYLGAPIRNKGKVIGFLNLNSNTPKFFTSLHAKRLLAFADQAGVAIETSRLINNLQNANTELTLAYDATLKGWVHALDLRDRETKGHSQRVTKMTIALAEALGLKADEMEHIRRGALLHDIGKIGVPDNILNKPGPLNDEERDIMNQHPIYAYEMLSPIHYLRLAVDIPYCHHERWDGSGYPQGLRGEDIPLAARIFAIVDVWDALVTDRPYRLAWSSKKALAYIVSKTDTLFDPSLVGVFKEMIEDRYELEKK